MLFSELLDDLQNLTKRKITQQQIADILKISQGAIAKRISRNSDFSQKEVSTIKDAMGVNDYEETILMDYYPEVFGSCGNGVFELSQEKEQIKISKKAIVNYSENAQYSIINAISDSMMPEIQPKDLLIVQHYQGEPIKDNHIYIFLYENAIFCKYLSNNLGQIIVRSENPLYPVKYIEKENLKNFNIIGEVKGHIRNYNIK